MDLILKRKEFLECGIFGEILTIDKEHLCFTLERSYNCKPKLPIGEYKCVRGMHRLPLMHYQFETFEVSGIPGHFGILFHAGNANKDSDGCILLGQTIALLSNGQKIVTHSRDTFRDFMDMQKGCKEFQLLVFDA